MINKNKSGGNQMKVYIIETVRAYEGSWIEKIFSTEEKARQFLKKNENNDELNLQIWEVE